ncbi:alpha/beta hydrolase [Sphingosinicella microcystinivorans]|uniref:alpha/beta hydrolase n=1 Tax=Sphingosinicella microcystinivorans TaxID=335406 RepID=UPI0022F3DCF0|nr:hypothetical protein [Sphingosinicella microcystinivorans]WBX85782.1 hypothetical protein PE061_07700 [Sphingosinicella microcystinivorans]
MATTALVYRENVPNGRRPQAVVVALHPEGHDEREAEARLSELKDDYHIIAPRAWRALNPRMYGPGENNYFAWFFMFRPDQPEPATFGDSLFQLEQFIHDVRERVPDVPVILAGWGQGAILAITLAGVIPEFLDGVYAVDGFLPSISGWSLPSSDLGRLPIALAYSAGSGRERLHGSQTRAALTGRGAAVGIEPADARSIHRWVQNISCRTRHSLAEAS